MDNLFKPKNTPFQKMEEFVRVDFSDYKSPIEVYIHEQWRQHKQKVEGIIEDNVFREVLSIGVDVDKKELLNALMYDRNQYGEGYAAGVRAAAPKWTSVEERLPEEDGMSVLCAVKDLWGTCVCEGYYSKTSNRVWPVEEDFALGEVTHWMPMPKPPEEEEG